MTFAPVDDAYMIKALKHGKAPEPDKIHTALIKDEADIICKPLTMIFNLSLKCGVFPN